MNKKIIIFLLLILFFTSHVFSQKKINIKGKVINKKTGEVVVCSAVKLKEIERWTITDENGRFEFDDISPNTYTLQIQCLGYVSYSAEMDFTKNIGKKIIIHLIPTSFDMKGVTIVAKRGGGITTTNKIGRVALEYVQPTSLGDVMQLVPGNISGNPDLSNPQKIAIREIGTDDNSAMGTAIIVDGAPISNDANLQTYSTATSSEGNYSTVAGTGVDLRQISTNNIESVEVIKGVPSVVYGDLTSGAVIVKTKAGYSPLEVKIKTDPKIKQISFNKGMKISNKNDFLNYSFEYIQSYSDVRSKYKGFNRITGAIAYSTVFLKNSTPLTFNAKANFYGTVDNTKTDPDAMVKDEEYETKNKGLRLNLHGKWTLNKKLISCLNYSFSTSISHQENWEKKYRSTNNIEAISISQTEGENIGIYLPTEQLTELKIDGMPINIFGQINTKKISTFKNKIVNSILFGAEYRLNGNNGDGQIYDIINPPFISSHSSRPRSFKQIPSLQNYSLYLEDKIIIPINTTRLAVQGGIRFNNFQSSGLFSSDLGFYFEPRFNLKYRILNKKNNDFFKKLTVNFGIGKNYKSPSLLYLYPDKAYYDIPVLDYYTGDPNTQTAIFYTKIFNTDNPNLKPSENFKREIGIDFCMGKIKGNITAFREDLTNGFSFVSKYLFIDYYHYDASEIPPGEKPNLSTLTKLYDNHIYSYRYATNNKKSVKKGVEFSLNLGKINFLYTSFIIDGAWFRTKRVYSTDTYEYLPSSASSNQYDFVGMYPAGESQIKEQLNTRLRMVTHIPELKLILSTTLQEIWYDKYYFPFYDEAPIYIFDKDNNVIQFTEDMRTNPDFIRYVNVKSDNYYLTEIMDPLLQLNFRLSKEITDKMKLSLFVNNFLNHRPMYKYIRGGSYVRRNSSIYFGAEFKVKL
ncbi:MAG: carboxypeptidase-like regulatory domain-containing protein [Bacteroidales bacterium]|nr:carboxypeptidase-like regulatory domain-containing protein [Bacteroidales bacterium]